MNSTLTQSNPENSSQIPSNLLKLAQLKMQVVNPHGGNNIVSFGRRLPEPESGFSQTPQGFVDANIPQTPERFGHTPVTSNVAVAVPINTKVDNKKVVEQVIPEPAKVTLKKPEDGSLNNIVAFFRKNGKGQIGGWDAEGVLNKMRAQGLK